MVRIFADAKVYFFTRYIITPMKRRILDINVEKISSDTIYIKQDASDLNEQFSDN